ncbi:MAG: hypothetical protein ACLGID_05835 [Gammaproteobacteria bacterium]|uniref:Uncharacterized protein n=1 Tax=Pseudomonas anguilliseptica TaxID=53406 RepID=A0A1H5DAM4_PSEAG|nr:hypothetical protein [Pseudomonas anguilliseptica]SED75838.1 hypothetical protein SAMN05421553_3266 [Pseudomonas anguilliseptica]
MKKTRYRYSGPQSAVSLRVGKAGELLDVQLLPGQPVDLPPEHEYTQVLLALNHLEPLAEDAAPAEKKGEKA